MKKTIRKVDDKIIKALLEKGFKCYRGKINFYQLRKIIKLRFQFNKYNQMFGQSINNQKISKTKCKRIMNTLIYSHIKEETKELFLFGRKIYIKIILNYLNELEK